jgi:hypothetical protein
MRKNISLSGRKLVNRQSIVQSTKGEQNSLDILTGPKEANQGGHEDLFIYNPDVRIRDKFFED